MSLLTPVLAVIAIPAMFLVLVAPHEGGHFALAKLFRMRVHEYSLFMGNKVWWTVRGGTTYAIRLIPVGGFVRLAGMEPGEYDEPNGFYKKPAWQRLLVLLAGPVVNFLIAALIMTGILLTQINTDPGLIAGVASGTPAASAGLRAGDSIKAVDGHPVASAQDIRHAENAHPGRALTLTVRTPKGRTEQVQIQPRYESAQHAYLIGIYSQTLTVPQALKQGATFPYTASVEIGGGLYQLATGQIAGGFLGPNGATGPIGIATVTYDAAAQGWFTWLFAVAFISVALGLTNLLPIPALDGGRILFVLLDAASHGIRHRPLDRDFETQINRASTVALVGLVLVITFFDIQRLALHQFPGPR